MLPSIRPEYVIKAEYFLQAVLKYPLGVMCPHCRSPRHELMARKYGVVRVVRCRDCGLSFTRPVYKSWLVDEFYDRLYAAEGSTTKMPNDAELTRLCETGFSDSDKNAAEALAMIRRLVPKPGASFLELGSSWGYLLHQARAVGFHTTGIEIGSARREFGNLKLGVDIVGDWSELPTGKQFDVIYTSHVLEHFTDLSQVFARFAERLAPDGVIFISVPNIDFRRHGTKHLNAIGAVHPLGFDIDFFRKNLPRYGLTVSGACSSWEEAVEGRQETPVGFCVNVIARHGSEAMSGSQQ